MPPETALHPSRLSACSRCAVLAPRRLSADTTRASRWSGAYQTPRRVTPPLSSNERKYAALDLGCQGCRRTKVRSRVKAGAGARQPARQGKWHVMSGEPQTDELRPRDRRSPWAQSFTRRSSHRRCARLRARKARRTRSMIGGQDRWACGRQVLESNDRHPGERRQAKRHDVVRGSRYVTSRYLRSREWSRRGRSR